MNFTIALKDLKILLKAVDLDRPGSHTLTLSACAARVFVECKGEVAGIEALVLFEGAVDLPAQKFRNLLKTYKGARFLSFDGSPDGLRVKTFWMPVLAYDPSPKPPANFHVFRPALAPGSGKTTGTFNRTP